MGRRATASSDNGQAQADKLADFRPQARNANRHTQRGMGLLESSIRTDGYSTPMVAAADGEIFDGSARIEKVGELLAEAEPIVVHSDGTRPVIHVRDDIPNASDPRAVRLAVAANRIAQVNLDWDIPMLTELPEITAAFWVPGEIEALLGKGAGENNPNEEWQGMPEFEQEDQLAKKSIKVNFLSEEDLRDFAKLIGQSLTMQTRSVWFPYQAPEDLKAMRFTDEP